MPCGFSAYFGTGAKAGEKIICAGLRNLIN